MELFIKLITLFYPKTEKLEINEELSYYIMKELDMIRAESLYKIHAHSNSKIMISSSFDSIISLNKALKDISVCLSNSTTYRSIDNQKRIQLASFFVDSRKKGYINEIEEFDKLCDSLPEIFKLRDQADEYCVTHSVLSNEVSANLAVTLRSLNNVLWELYELLVVLRGIVDKD